MKSLNRVLVAATVAAGLVSAGQAVAQSQLSGPNGTAMSPKLRFLLAPPPARSIMLPAQPAAVWPSGVNTAAVAASPKQQQMVTQSQTAQSKRESGSIAVYRPTGPDGITASPRLRQMLDENAPQFQIAPLK